MQGITQAQESSLIFTIDSLLCFGLGRPAVFAITSYRQRKFEDCEYFQKCEHEMEEGYKETEKEMEM